MQLGKLQPTSEQSCIDMVYHVTSVRYAIRFGGSRKIVKQEFPACVNFRYNVYYPMYKIKRHTAYVDFLKKGFQYKLRSKKISYRDKCSKHRLISQKNFP